MEEENIYIDIANSFSIEDENQREYKKKYDQELQKTNEQAEQLQSMKKKQKEEEEQKKEIEFCIVCLNKQRTHATIPCGHFRYCEDCSLVMLKN